MKFSSILAAAALTLSLFSSLCSAAPRIVGYFPSWGDSTLATVDFTKYSHILFSFCLPNDDGSIANNDDNLENSMLLHYLVREAHKNGVRVGLAVGGYTYGDQFTAVGDNIGTFVADIRSLVDLYNLDGIDIDWEYPGNATIFDQLMAALRTELDKDGKFLSMAVVGDITGGNADGIGDGSLDDCDFINLMSYDGSSADASINGWINDRGVSPSKLNLGIDFVKESGDVGSNAGLVGDNNMGGAMCWGLDYDPDNSLVDEVAAAVGSPQHATFLSTCAGAGSITRTPKQTSFNTGTITAVTLNAVTPSGYRFAGWSGDAIGSNTTTTLAMSSSKFASAVFIPLTDDSTDFIAHPDADWNGACDNASTLDTALSPAGEGYSIPFTLARDDDAYLEVAANMPGGIAATGMSDIKITYRSTVPLNMMLAQSNLADSGTSYSYSLDAAASDRTVCIPVGEFIQPSYANGSGIAPLDLSKVSAIAFSPDASNYVAAVSGTFNVSELVVYGVAAPLTGALSQTAAVQSIQKCTLMPQSPTLRFSLGGFPSGMYNVSVVGVNGRAIQSSAVRSCGSPMTLSADAASAHGAYIVSVDGKDVKKAFRIVR